MQSHTLGNPLDGVQYARHLGVIFFSTGLCLPGTDCIFKLLQLRRALLDKGIKELGEDLAATRAAMAEVNTLGYTPGHILSDCLARLNCRH